MKRICVISTSRADYYLLSLICKKIKLSKNSNFFLLHQVIILFLTKAIYRDILKDGFKIDFKIPSKHRLDSRKSIISNFLTLLGSIKKHFQK